MTERCQPHGGPNLHGPRSNRVLCLALGHDPFQRHLKVAPSPAAFVVQYPIEPLQQAKLHDRGLVRGALDQSVRDRRELRASRAGVAIVRSVLNQLGRPSLRCPIQLIDELLLAREVPVDRAFGDPGLPRDERRRRVVIAQRGEQLQSGPHQTLPRQFGCGHGCESTSFPAA